MPSSGRGPACSTGGANGSGTMRAIRGRGEALGSRDGVQHLEPAIRGPTDGPGPRGEGAQHRAQARLDAKNCHLLRSFEDHADRVRKRRASDLLADTGPSAAERLAALRRRIADKSAGHRVVAEVGSVQQQECGQGRGGVRAQAAEGSRASPNASADALDDNSAWSIEDRKIHQEVVHDEFGCTACSSRSSGEGASGVLASMDTGLGVGNQSPQAVAKRQGAASPPATAVIASAACVAWHDVAAGGCSVDAPDGAR